MSSATSNSTSASVLLRKANDVMRNAQACVFREAAERIDGDRTGFACLAICDAAGESRIHGCPESAWFDKTFRPILGLDEHRGEAFLSDPRGDDAASKRHRVIALLFAAAIAEGGGL